MNALRAEKSLFSPEIAPVRTRSRDEALASAVEKPEQLTIHEQAVDPMVYRAASELIRLDDDGRKTDIEAQGKVYDVLQSVEDGLKEVGVSHLITAQILDTLAHYVSGLGADFARQAKAKPLYARIMVTDREPEDIPDCKLQSVTCIDGHRVQGDDAGKMSMTLTLYGTSNAMSQGMSMDRIFESGKKKWLLIYYGTVEGSDLNRFDTVDADLATLVQAVGAGGAAAMEEIRQAIEQGTLPSEIMNLIAAVADLNRALEAAKTPGALENPERTIADLKALVAEMTQAVPDMHALPPELVRAAAQSIENADSAFLNPDVLQPPSNDNDTAMQIMADLNRVAGEKIEILLRDENTAPEIKERLREIAQTMEAARESKDFSKLALAVTEIYQAAGESAPAQFLANSAADARVVAALAAITPEVLKSLPPDMQKPVLEMQSGVLAASSREAVLGRQLLAIGYDKRHALQDLIENSGLSVTERQKLIRELQGGQAPIETLRHIVNRVETTTPGLNTSAIRADMDGMIRHAGQGMDTRTYPVTIDQAIKERVVDAIARLPLPAPVIRDIGGGQPVSIPVLATVIAAAGESPSPEVKHYIREATKQIAKEQAKLIVDLHERYPIPGMTKRDLDDLKKGNFISPDRMRALKDNPELPLPVRRELEKYQAVQVQLAPYVSPRTIQRELAQIQNVLMGTDPAMAKSIETFRLRNPDATAADVENYVSTMPAHARARFDDAADYVSRQAGEQGFISTNPSEVARLLDKASFAADPYEKVFLDEMADRIRMGDPVSRSDLDRISDVANFDIHDYSYFSDGMAPLEEKKGVSSICPHACGGDCDACKNFSAANLRKAGADAGAMASVESSGYSRGYDL